MGLLPRKLRNPVYVGEMKSKKWSTQQGLHEPIADKHVFRNVQLICLASLPRSDAVPDWDDARLRFHQLI